MSEEEKGFVIKDRRALDEKGELKDKGSEEVKKEEETKEQAAKEEAQKPPLPEANFTSLIFSLSSSALFHFGEIPDPTTGEKKEDLPIAKHAIDTIAMLKEKTQGNLTEEEQKFIESVLTDLKWRFVKAAK
jgi:DNA replication initiation complex subunit (GINS family)